MMIVCPLQKSQKNKTDHEGNGILASLGEIELEKLVGVRFRGGGATL